MLYFRLCIRKLNLACAGVAKIPGRVSKAAAGVKHIPITETKRSVKLSEYSSSDNLSTS